MVEGPEPELDGDAVEARAGLAIVPTKEGGAVGGADELGLAGGCSAVPELDGEA